MPAERPAVVLGLLWAGLSFARSLGRAGIPVTGITMHPNEFGARSRYLRDVSRARGDEAVLKALRASAQGDTKPVLLPERDDHGIIVAFECWCGAEQTMLTGSRIDHRETVAA